MSFVSRDGERLLQINVAPGLLTLFTQRKVALRRRSDVDDLWFRDAQHLANIRESLRNTEALAELRGHEQFPIAHRNNPAAGDPLNGLNMLIGNLAAADDGYAEHEAWPIGCWNWPR
jgi:hypothetical protein